MRRKNIKFVPVNWFEFDVFRGRFDEFDDEKQLELEEELSIWINRQLETWNNREVPFNSKEYDQITKEKYNWL